MKVEDEAESTVDNEPEFTLGKTGLLEAPEPRRQQRELLPQAEEFSFPIMIHSLGASL